MGLIATTIEAIVNTLTTTTTYVRASKLAEANKKLPQIDIVTNPIALYYDTDQITTEVNASGVVEVHAVKIAFLKRSTPDNTGIAEDALRDSMKTSATEFYQSLVANFSNIFEQFQGYQLDPATTGEKVFNEVMTGYTLTVDIRVLGACSTVSVVGTLVNSEGTTINTLSPGETKTQPDITVTQTDDTTALHPSDKDLDVDNFQGAGITTWDGLVSAVGRGYNYPPPPHTTQFRTGDAAWVEANIFTTAIRTANKIRAINGLVSFKVLINNNSFGNTDRFTDDAGGQTYTLPYVIDHFTGLGWADISEISATFNKIWNSDIDDCLGTDHGGNNSVAVDIGIDVFTDWFLPGSLQFWTLQDFELAPTPLNYAPFLSTNTSRIHKFSDTEVNNSTSSVAFRHNGIANWATAQAKATIGRPAQLCRKHF